MTDHELKDRLWPIRYRDSFQNWARNIQCRPRGLMRPRTEEEVRLVIELARREGREVRCVGAGHSPSDLACSSDYMMNLDNLSGEIKFDEAAMCIEVFAGTRLNSFNDLARSHGLALSTLGSISAQSIAGALSTATHGCGAKFGILSTLVRSLTLILADTTQIVVSEEEGQDIFRAALCGLGSIGVITRVQMQCEPTFNLEEVVSELSFRDFLDHFEDIGKSGEHVRMYWFPHVDKVRVECLNRTNKPQTPPPGLLASAVTHSYTHWIHPFNLLLSRNFSGFLQLHASLAYKFIHKPSGSVSIPQKPDSIRGDEPSTPSPKSIIEAEVNRIADSVSVFNFDCGERQYTYEGAVPYLNTVSVLKHMNQWMKNEMAKPDGQRPHFPVEIRPVASDDIWLSPSSGRLTTYIGLVQYKPFGQPVKYKGLFSEFERTILNADGRPHWAKAHACSPVQLERMYPRFHDFLALRATLDPEGRFLNPYIRRHLLGQIGEPMDMRRFKARL
ncbi:hypothetical protein CROQUDRAFT_47611 [Cronartium quercuum f. sp. fusiforme G11]|uniref:D-arabinono-1,4-lactone oxidase n=1 Tax=Cronartium quercuum f. sp. fusiforme G11 TaxID=708437 RepID=A0A9P6NCK9_9BASI|nr:hypothetical protein CROQUDRAFT_47611 [Cronartium quercuum f. sp. fusiforme G11]